MKALTLLQPPRIAVGEGCAKACVDFLVERGLKEAFVVTSSAVLPALAGFMESLKDGGVKAVQGPCIDEEPSVTLFERVLQSARDTTADCVIGVGGGSAIDVAKLVAALIHASQPVQDAFGINRLKARSLPLICLPTTAGTGAEVSPNAILLDEVDALKKGVVSPHLVPDAAFVDATLTLSVPPAVTAATGIDALTHCIEAYTNKFAHPAVDVYALQGIRLIVSHLARAVRDGNDLEARSSLALGSLYGGLCLGPVNTAAVHALAYPLGGRFHVPHGVSNAVLLPTVSRFNLSAAPKRYADVAVALGVQGAGTLEQTAEKGIDVIAALARECGIPRGLKDLGVPRDAIPSMAQSAMQVTRLLKNNPRPMEEEDAIAIYEACY